jgi:hypothetical protein
MLFILENKGAKGLITICRKDLQIVQRYKYLGLVFDEYLNYKVSAEVLADSGGRALGAIINKYKTINDKVILYHLYLVRDLYK